MKNNIQLSSFHEIFNHLSEEELKLIVNGLKKMTLTPGQFLFFEGSMGKEIYLIAKGELKIKVQGHDLADLKAGDFVGEMSVLDQRQRSASIYTSTSAELYVLDFEKIKEQNPIIANKIIINISKVLAKRIRVSNELSVENLRSKIDLLNNQTSMARLFSYCLSTIALFVIILHIFIKLNIASLAADNITIRLTLFLTITLFFVMLKNHCTFKELGLTLRHSIPALRESLGMTLLLLMIMFLTAWLGSRPHLLLNVPNIWTLFFGFLIFSPIQEFIVRGCLQHALSKFFRGKYSQLKIILISNLVFTSFLINLAPVAIMVTFLLGLIWGWLYSRHKTLIGVSLSHFIIGFFMALILNINILGIS